MVINQSIVTQVNDKDQSILLSDQSSIFAEQSSFSGRVSRHDYARESYLLYKDSKFLPILQKDWAEDTSKLYASGGGGSGGGAAVAFALYSSTVRCSRALSQVPALKSVPNQTQTYQPTTVRLVNVR